MVRRVGDGDFQPSPASRVVRVFRCIPVPVDDLDGAADPVVDRHDFVARWIGLLDCRPRTPRAQIQARQVRRVRRVQTHAVCQIVVICPRSLEEFRRCACIATLHAEPAVAETRGQR